ncbi:MAG: hypothetical protein WDN46_03345 [Methylocella sp.]
MKAADLPAAPGMYIVAFGRPSDSAPVYVGESQNVRSAFERSQPWRKAREISEEALFFLRLDLSDPD